MGRTLFCFWSIHLKIAVITDQHFGVRGNSPVFHEEFKRYYREQFFPYLEEHNIKQIVDGGDFWEERQGVDAATLALARAEYYDVCAHRGIKETKQLGNHDVRYRNTNAVNSIEFLTKIYPHIHLIDEREVVEFDGWRLGMMSWVNKQNLVESLQWMDSVADDVDTLFGHFEIKDFEMTKGSVAKHGFERDLFKKFKEVWSGHFHVRDEIGNIRYLSNQMQTTWADVGLDKGFHVFDTDTRELTPVDNTHDMFLRIRWGEDDYTPQDCARRFVQVVIPAMTEDSRAEIDLFINEASSVAYDVKSVEEAVILRETDVTQEDTETVTTPGLISEYVRDVVKSRAEIDADKLERMFMERYNAAAATMEVE